MTPTQVAHTAASLRGLYARPQTDWLLQWLDLLKCKLCGDYSDALRVAKDLLHNVGDYNTQVWLEVAECHCRASNFSEAVAAFEKVMQEDYFNMEKMDMYAAVLRRCPLHWHISTGPWLRGSGSNIWDTLPEQS